MVGHGWPWENIVYGRILLNGAMVLTMVRFGLGIRRISLNNMPECQLVYWELFLMSIWAAAGWGWGWGCWLDLEHHQSCFCHPGCHGVSWCGESAMDHHHPTQLMMIIIRLSQPVKNPPSQWLIYQRSSTVRMGLELNPITTSYILVCTVDFLLQSEWD